MSEVGCRRSDVDVRCQRSDNCTSDQDLISSGSSLSDLRPPTTDHRPPTSDIPMPDHRLISPAAAPTPLGPYSPAVGFDRLVFVSGQGARDPLTGRIADDIERQTEGCFNVQAILKAAGSELQHVLRCGVFLIDMK